MKNIYWGFLLAGFILLQQQGYSQSTETLHNLFGHLKGKWMFGQGGEEMHEDWQFLNDSTMIGVFYSVKDGKAEIMENIRLTRSGTTIQYIPVIEGEHNGQPVPFTLVSVATTKEGVGPEDAHSDVTATFSNTSNDFPKYIRYRVREEGVEVIIANDPGLTERKQEFKFHRAPDKGR